MDLNQCCVRMILAEPAIAIFGKKPSKMADRHISKIIQTQENYNNGRIGIQMFIKFVRRCDKVFCGIVKTIFLYSRSYFE